MKRFNELYESVIVEELTKDTKTQIKNFMKALRAKGGKTYYNVKTYTKTKINYKKIKEWLLDIGESDIEKFEKVMKNNNLETQSDCYKFFKYWGY